MPERSLLSAEHRPYWARGDVREAVRLAHRAFCEVVLFKEPASRTGHQAGGKRPHKGATTCRKGLWLGRSVTSNAMLVGTPDGVMTTRTVRRLIADDRLDKSLLETLRGVPWGTQFQIGRPRAQIVAPVGDGGAPGDAPAPAAAEPPAPPRAPSSSSTTSSSSSAEMKASNTAGPTTVADVVDMELAVPAASRTDRPSGELPTSPKRAHLEEDSQLSLPQLAEGEGPKKEDEAREPVARSSGDASQSKRSRGVGEVGAISAEHVGEMPDYWEVVEMPEGSRSSMTT